jgi:HIRAN domain
METLAIVVLAILVLWVVSKLASKQGTRSEGDEQFTKTVSLGELVPPELANLEIEDHYVIRVAGVSHLNDDGSSRQEVLSRCKVGEMLQLRRQPNHRHDKNAVQVLRQNGEMLGFIPRDEARLMAPEIDRGRRYVAVLTTLDGGHGSKRFLGAGMLIVKVKEFPKPTAA